eukprot:4387180-Prymnesium_polylepis.1
MMHTVPTRWPGDTCRLVQMGRRAFLRGQCHCEDCTMAVNEHRRRVARAAPIIQFVFATEHGGRSTVHSRPTVRGH